MSLQAARKEELLSPSEVDLHRRFPEMEPVKEAPSLRTVNGCGGMLLGCRDVDAATGTYVATLAFVLIFVPVFFQDAYRVKSAPSGGWYFLGKVPISARARCWNWIAGPVALQCVTWFIAKCFVMELIEACDPYGRKIPGIVGFGCSALFTALVVSTAYFRTRFKQRRGPDHARPIE